MKKRKNILQLMAVFIIALAPYSLIFSQEIQVSAPQEVLEGEVFQVQYEVFSYRPLRENPRMLDDKDFELVGDPDTRYLHPSPFWGRDYYTLRLTCNFKAKKKGKLKLPRIEIVADGEKISSEKREILVRELPNIDDVKCFVEVSQTKRSVKVGDTLTVTYKLYSTKDIAGISRFDTPQLSGFNMQDMTPRRLSASEEEIDGVRYKVYIIRQLLLQPTRVGTREFPAGTIDVEYNYPTGRIGRDRWGRRYEEQLRDTKECEVDAIVIRVHDMISV